MNELLSTLKEKGWSANEAFLALHESRLFAFAHFDTDADKQTAFRNGRDAFIEKLLSFTPEELKANEKTPNLIVSGLRKAFIEGALGHEVSNVYDGFVEFHQKHFPGRSSEAMPVDIFKTDIEVTKTMFNMGLDASIKQTTFSQLSDKENAWERLSAISESQLPSMELRETRWGTLDFASIEARHDAFTQRTMMDFGIDSIRLGSGVDTASAQTLLTRYNKGFATLSEFTGIDSSKIGFGGSDYHVNAHIDAGGYHLGMENRSLFAFRGGRSVSILGHEWFHGFDFNIAKNSAMPGYYASSLADPNRPDARSMMANTSLDILKTATHFKEVMDILMLKGDRTLRDMREMKPREITDWIMGSVGEELFDRMNVNDDASKDEMRKIVKDMAKGKADISDFKQWRDDKFGLRSKELVFFDPMIAAPIEVYRSESPSAGKSMMYHVADVWGKYAVKASGDKSWGNYATDPVEMIARGFEGAIVEGLPPEKASLLTHGNASPWLATMGEAQRVAPAFKTMFKNLEPRMDIAFATKSSPEQTAKAHPHAAVGSLAEFQEPPKSVVEPASTKSRLQHADAKISKATAAGGGGLSFVQSFVAGKEAIHEAKAGNRRDAGIAATESVAAAAVGGATLANVVKGTTNLATKAAGPVGVLLGYTSTVKTLVRANDAEKAGLTEERKHLDDVAKTKAIGATAGLGVAIGIEKVVAKFKTAPKSVGGLLAMGGAIAVGMIGENIAEKKEHVHQVSGDDIKRKIAEKQTQASTLTQTNKLN